MIMEINRYKVNVIEKPTNIFGLKYEPQLEDKYNNDADIAYFHRAGFVELSDKNIELMNVLSKRYSTHGIMEIGVSKNEPRSFTNILLSNKSDDVPYIGLVTNHKLHLDNFSKNIFTTRESSSNQLMIRNFIRSIGIKKISILVIDGWHSVNAVINDWKYTDLLSDDAVVVFHDTNYHPGPALILPAIDEKLFKVEKFFENEFDYGMATAYRI